MGVSSAACKGSQAATLPATKAAPSSSAAPLSSAERQGGGVPVPPDQIEAQVNSTHLPVYTGPTAAIEGVITVKGDPPPNARFYPPASGHCSEASAMHRSLFRVSPTGALADAVVGVTDYPAYVPERSESEAIHIHGCAYDRRTVVLTFGQRMEIVNDDLTETYMPLLVGAHNPAEMMMLPHTDPVKLYPRQPGRFLLKDDYRHDWMRADVLVLKYSTHAVSRDDGHFRVDNIPAGKVKLGVFHPALHDTRTLEVELSPGESRTMNIELTFDPKRDGPPQLEKVRGQVLK